MTPPTSSLPTSPRSGASRGRAGGRSHSALAAAAGVIVVQLLGVLPCCGPLRAARAAWCWDAGPPKCKAPVVPHGSCEEGTDIPAGSSCTPNCGGGKVPVGACTVKCPPTLTDTNMCMGDIEAGTWWDPCGYGDVCVGYLQLGTAESSEYGTFECVHPSSRDAKEKACSEVELEEVENKGPLWDGATLGLLAGLGFLLLVAAALSRMSGKSAFVRMLHKPGPQGWTLGNVIAVALTAIGLVAFCAGLGADANGIDLVFVLGLAAGIATSLPVWWSFFRAGAHSVAGMSREAAWRIHVAFGNLALLFSLAHGMAAMKNVTDVFSNVFWVLGFVGLVLMWLGVLPALVQVMMPDKLSYDKWKYMHFASAWGYLLVVVHMLDHARVFQTVRSIVVAAINTLALLALIAQKIYAKVTTPVAQVDSAQVISDSEGSHVILGMYVRGFKYVAGQWGYLQVPSLSGVPHPFTIVPGSKGSQQDCEHVQLFIKVSGPFTQALASSCLASAPKKVRLEGPYGVPPSVTSASADAVIFVVGGVGVTPALSLVSKARETHGADRVRLFWSLRSPALLNHCAPLLEPHLEPSLCGVWLKRGVVPANEVSGLPLGAKEGRGNVTEWFNLVDADLAALGVKSPLLFVCGEPGLADMAKRAAANPGVRGSGLKWQVHIEQFRFLPQPPMRRQKPAGALVPASRIGGGVE